MGTIGRYRVSSSVLWSKYENVVNRYTDNKCDMANIAGYLRAELWYNAYAISGGKRPRLGAHEKMKSPKRRDMVLPDIIEACIKCQVAVAKFRMQNENIDMCNKAEFSDMMKKINEHISKLNSRGASNITPSGSYEYLLYWVTRECDLALKIDFNAHNTYSIDTAFERALYGCMHNYLYSACINRNCPIIKGCGSKTDLLQDITKCMRMLGGIFVCK